MTITLNGTTGITTPAITDVSTGNVAYTGTLTGGTGIVNLGSGQLVKDAAGNVGLGVTPSAWGSGWKALQLPNGTSISSHPAVAYTYYTSNGYFDSSSNIRYIAAGGATQYAHGGFDGRHLWYTAPSGTAGAAIAFAQAMTLDASGNLLVGTTSTGGNAGIQIIPNAGNCFQSINHITGSASGSSYLYFNYAGSSIGTITQTGTTAVLYNTTSDYRLKTVIGPVADAGSRIDSLQPVEYEWKADGVRTRGFLAHQFQEVYAGSVTGTKDAVDEDGKPKYQAMQASSSEVIADLIAEIQSLRKRLTALENK